MDSMQQARMRQGGSIAKGLGRPQQTLPSQPSPQPSPLQSHRMLLRCVSRRASVRACMDIASLVSIVLMRISALPLLTYALVALGVTLWRSAPSLASHTASSIRQDRTQRWEEDLEFHRGPDMQPSVDGDPCQHCCSQCRKELSRLLILLLSGDACVNKRVWCYMNVSI